jgi:DNA-binding helix-hairpin-helix protein with protein kinase domain
MSIISGVSEGTWIVFAEKAMAERDEATAKLAAVAKLLVANGCDCECAHHYQEHDDDCERCLACKVSDAIGELA